MSSPHALMLPYPAQGHVIPLMELAHCLVDRGFKVTFINTDFNHDRVVAALSKKGDAMGRIHLVTIPDGLRPGEDRNDLGKLTEGILNIMPGCLEELIRDTDNKGEKITCFIADKNMAWTFEVARKMGLRSVAFWPASAGLLATILSIPKLINDGIIEEDGKR